MDDLSDLMAQDVDEGVGKRVPKEEDFETIGGLVDSQLKYEREIEDAEAFIAETKKKLTEVSQKLLPEAIEKFGLSSFKLTDGTEIKLKDEVYAGITKENSERALAWLHDSGNDGIIKNEVTSSFGKGQEADARQLIELLNSRGFSFSNKRHVHPSTLKAFVKDKLEAGEMIPADLFSVHIQKVSKIVLPKKR